MKANLKTYLTLLMLFAGAVVYAQTNTEDSKKLVKEGIILHDAGKYSEAIDKYDQAIKLDPENATAYFEKGYTLMSSGKSKDAIPVIEKVLQLDPKTGGAYDMLGTIYDDDKQTDKAIEMYKKGIEMDPGYERLHFNLSITYLRQKKYPEAETCAIDAIKLDSKHASAMRIYALAAYHQEKRDCSLLAWCSFLMLEPTTTRSAEAYKYVRNILNSYVRWPASNQISLGSFPKSDTVSGAAFATVAIMGQMLMSKDMSPTDSLAIHLSMVFRALYQISSKQPASFYSVYFARYFGDLAGSDNMPTFARLVSYGVAKDESQRWFDEHKKELTALNDWVTKTGRSF